ncbi:MAG: TRAM domain-containing protein [Candidatus Tectomicrobia bacterium]|uniref:TRAM domain-containing protein n=1 Tax=Tectimicrobiota bacterium TaxID=2528274 RepID=A0A933GLI9_UNCTE|nr:TRAM domain-containing protein [Candidatus Tectomicrobia bacterium]
MKGGERVGLNIIRGAILLIGLVFGYFWGKNIQISGFAGIVIGLSMGLGMILIERKLHKVNWQALVGGFFGFILGLITANLMTYSIFHLTSDTTILSMSFRLFINALFGYLGLVVGGKKAEEIELSKIKLLFTKEGSNENVKILDTSVIIDGRIADICETGFVEGKLIIPQFILRELQHIADSSDSIKRNRGRRGLDILNKIQRNAELNIEIIEQDFPKIKEVDGKLVVLAKLIGGKILTNDYNLNKIAELQGVSVLNINQLANAVKPVVLPGEVMTVRILREGKEYAQGVAYLDDGTMVVVDNAKRYIGLDVEVAVTSVLQTTAGRMIFTKLKEDIEHNETIN